MHAVISTLSVSAGKCVVGSLVPAGLGTWRPGHFLLLQAPVVHCHGNTFGTLSENTRAGALGVRSERKLIIYELECGQSSPRLTFVY